MKLNNDRKIYIYIYIWYCFCNDEQPSTFLKIVKQIKVIKEVVLLGISKLTLEKKDQKQFSQKKERKMKKGWEKENWFNIADYIPNHSTWWIMLQSNSKRLFFITCLKMPFIQWRKNIRIEIK